MQLIVGTYERFLLGFDLPSTEQLQEGCSLKRAFTYAAHQGPVRCLDAAGAWVVSGGQDDQLHLYDVKHGRDQGFLVNPGTGPVTAAALFTPPGRAAPTHLLSGGADGALAIWRSGGGWEALKLMRGHRGAVNGLALHPSGRLALSVGHDVALRMWNMARGRCSYTARLDAEADAVAFARAGQAYLLLCGRTVTLHDAATAGPPLARLAHERRAVSMLASPDGSALLTGLDNGTLCLWDVRSPGATAAQLVHGAHASRVRAIVSVTPDSDGGLPTMLASASSDGAVKLWDVRALCSGGGTGAAPLSLAAVPTQGRITCMALSAPRRLAPAYEAGETADNDSECHSGGDDDGERGDAAPHAPASSHDRQAAGQPAALLQPCRQQSSFEQGSKLKAAKYQMEQQQQSTRAKRLAPAFAIEPSRRSQLDHGGNEALVPRVDGKPLKQQKRSRSGLNQSSSC